MRPGRAAVIAAFAVVLCVAAPPEALGRANTHKHAHAPAPPTALDARVTGTFEMLARVTTAKNVRGEHVGQSLKRRWLISPQSCAGNVCQALDLDRERSAGIDESLALHRVAAGTYTGSGSFYVALRCKHKTYPHGSRAPYRITLTVSSAVSVQGITFARAIIATYHNPKRSDSTPCVLGKSHDAARYTGTATSAIPSPPVASFSTQLDGATDSASFTDTSTPATGGAQIVSTQWSFGDPASGAGDSSTEAAPSHQFSAPGVYTVTLTVTDANGLSSTTTQPVTAPGPPTAAFTATRNGPTTTFSFADQSRLGIGAVPITSWSWQFGDPGSGPADQSTLQDPTHEFSQPGVYQVTLTITDADGRQSTSTQQIIVSGPPHAAFTATEQGITATFTFKDESTAGVDGPAIVGWAWNFGDPSSDASVEFNRQRARLAPEWGRVADSSRPVGHFPIAEPAAQPAQILRGSAR
ncbi:MAG TPA: PKD domain-containing protein [Solirubrobacteraceae bacterium]